MAEPIPLGKVPLLRLSIEVLTKEQDFSHNLKSKKTKELNILYLQRPNTSHNLSKKKSFMKKKLKPLKTPYLTIIIVIKAIKQLDMRKRARSLRPTTI